MILQVLVLLTGLKYNPFLTAKLVYWSYNPQQVEMILQV